ncbi:NLR family CARD domain-containing protein 3-like isoform X2 [Dermacentor albipictus]
MESASSNLRDLECAIPSLDSVRLSTRFQQLLNRLKVRGVDLHEPCGSTVGSATCWLTGQLPALNEILWAAFVQVVEHAPGVLTLNCVRSDRIDNIPTASSLLEPSCLIYWLLRHHACIEKLVLGLKTVPLMHFPAVLSKALQASTGLVEVEAHRKRMYCGRPVDCAIETRVLWPLTPRLKSLDVTPFELDRAAADSLAEAISGRSNLRRLILGTVAPVVAKKVYGALGASQSLRSLQLLNSEPLSLESADLLAAALARNKTLRDLTVKNLHHPDAAPIILASLKYNDVLEELWLDDGSSRPETLREGLLALRTNKSLKCLKLTDMKLNDVCVELVGYLLEKNDTLQEVSLSGNLIHDPGVCSIPAALSQNTTIKRLDLSLSWLSKYTVSNFVRALSGNSTVESVHLGSVVIHEDWRPPLPLTADIFARLQVTWGKAQLEEWTSCLEREEHCVPSRCVFWYDRDRTEVITRFFSAAVVTGSSLTELVVYFPGWAKSAEAVKALVSFLEVTLTLKKLEIRPRRMSYSYPSELLSSIARNKSLCEAEFMQPLEHSDVKALEAVLKANRTLQRLKFFENCLAEEDPRMLARSLKKNFVFLNLEFSVVHVPIDMHPVLSALNRNRTALNNAVRCVLDATVDDSSRRALHALSASDSLLDAVVSASGKTRDACKSLILEAVRHVDLSKHTAKP